MKTDKIIESIYPKGLDFEFTNEEKNAYLKAVNDLKSFYNAIILKELKYLLDDYNKGFIDSTDEWYREIVSLQEKYIDSIENNKIDGVTIGDEYKDDTIQDGVVVDFVETRDLLRKNLKNLKAIVEYTNKYKDWVKNTISVPIWKIRVYNEEQQKNYEV